jgi:NAD-dependent SIR2 family protein deacetylase
MKGDIWYCNECDHEWEQRKAGNIEKCPLCKSTLIKNFYNQVREVRLNKKKLVSLRAIGLFLFVLTTFIVAMRTSAHVALIVLIAILLTMTFVKFTRLNAEIRRLKREIRI